MSLKTDFFFASVYAAATVWILIVCIFVSAKEPSRALSSLSTFIYPREKRKRRMRPKGTRITADRVGLVGGSPRGKMPFHFLFLLSIYTGISQLLANTRNVCREVDIELYPYEIT